MDGLLDNGSSVFHRLVAVSIRKLDGTLLQCTGPGSEDTSQHWDTLRAHDIIKDISQDAPQTSVFDLPFTLTSTTTDASEETVTKVVLVESFDSSRSHVLGAIIKANPNEDTVASDSYFLELILKSLQLVPEAAGQTSGASKSNVANQVTDLFDTRLRYSGPTDKWLEKGRSYFFDRVNYYTSQGAKINLALPAFPCKSSNTDKVGPTDLPDRGEFIALQNLHRFIEDIEAIYPPGACLWIISDGHVFSDCIGVDDDVVNNYTKELRDMNDKVGGDRRDRVQFQSLVEILKLMPDDIKEQALAARLGLPTIAHHIDGVQMNDEAELCRRILMSGFSASPKKLRDKIDNQEPATLALYRGFSRFMLEDLEKNPLTESLSKSKRRKLSSKVAFEMIERNQAYSNLVEMVFPQHVRLSIHAHDNSGPKFGIAMMGPHVKATNEITLDEDAEAATSSDLLHVPTPWHSCIVSIEGREDKLLMTKAAKVKEVLEEENVDGDWVEAEIDEAGELKTDELVPVEEKAEAEAGQGVAFFHIKTADDASPRTSEQTEVEAVKEHDAVRSPSSVENVNDQQSPKPEAATSPPVEPEAQNHPGHELNEKDRLSSSSEDEDAVVAAKEEAQAAADLPTTVPAGSRTDGLKPSAVQAFFSSLLKPFSRCFTTGN